MHKSKYLLITVLFSAFFSSYGQPFTSKTEKSYLKGENAMIKGDSLKAEKIFLKIIDREEHGKSYYQLAVINEKHDITTALAYYNTSLRLLNLEMDYLNTYSGSEFDKLTVENFISNAKTGIVACGGLTPEMMVEASEKREFEEKPDLSYKEVDLTLTETADFDFTFYDDGQVSTYYTVIDKPVTGYRMPNYAELESSLSSLLSSSEGREKLKQLKQGNKILRFVSSDLYFNEENMHLSRGYIVDIDRLALIKEDIELGDLATIILIRK